MPISHSVGIAAWVMLMYHLQPLPKSTEDKPTAVEVPQTIWDNLDGLTAPDLDPLTADQIKLVSRYRGYAALNMLSGNYSS
jgi:hypothetical protein